MRLKDSAVLAIACSLLSTNGVFAYGEELVGKVIGIIDGDTIVVRAGRTVEKVRLSGIDCPERFLFNPKYSQPYADKAIAFTETAKAHRG